MSDAPPVRRTYKYRLFPTAVQARELERQLGLCCDLYNAALEQRRRMWRDHGVSIGYREQSRQLTEARAEFPWMRGMNALAQHGVLKRLDRAYEAFFRRCAAGQAPGYPRFRARARYDSLSWPQYGNGARFAEVGERNGRVIVQGVGAVKFRAHRAVPAGAKLGQVTVRRSAGRWWLTIALELPPRERSGGEPDSGSPRVVGLDVGVEELAALSTGERIRAPRLGRGRIRALRRAQRRVSRRRRGSLSRRRAVRTLARAQEDVANARRDHAHKLARSLAERYPVIAVEDLDVRAMSASARGTLEEPGRRVRAKAGLNRAILDSGWGQLRDLLAYKVEERGGQLVEVPARYSSQTCAQCGHRAAESRASRAVFACVACGHAAHADVNAARIIAERGEEQLAPPAGVEPAQQGLRDPWPDPPVGATAAPKGDDDNARVNRVARPGAGAHGAPPDTSREFERPASDGGPLVVHGAGEPRVEDALESGAPSKPNRSPEGVRSASRDNTLAGGSGSSQADRRAKPAEQGRDNTLAGGSGSSRPARVRGGR